MADAHLEAPPLRLAETVVVAPAADSLRLIRGADVLRIRGSAEKLSAVVEALRSGVRIAEHPCEDPHDEMVRRVAMRLDRLGWLTRHDPASRQGSTVERQLGYLSLFGPDALAMQERIEAGRVAVLGVGAVGGVVAQHMVGAGVRQFWLVDHDRVERHNLNRQFLAGWDDVGETKTSVATRALKRLAPTADIHGVNRFVGCPEDLETLPDDLDLLVVAADMPPGIAGIAWRWAASRGVPMCLAAVGIGTGYWGPILVPGRGHCWDCFERTRTSRLTPEDAALEREFQTPTPYSFGPANTVISALLAHEALCFLATGHSEVLNRRGHFRFSNGATSFFENQECVCDSSRSMKGQNID